jgi:4-hydroxy-3-methylbut-2-enyl diphosphate reductase
MVHCSELSWKRIKSPAEVLAIGDEITVFVKSYDAEKKRISLGYKTEATNPWFIFTHQYAIGDTAAVKIVSLMPFGAFAEIVDGVDGLIHISQIADHKIGKPADVLEVGQVVDAKIIDIDNDNQKVSLSIRALLEEAKATEEAAPVEAAEDGVVFTTEE